MEHFKQALNIIGDKDTAGNSSIKQPNQGISTFKKDPGDLGI
ncbi:hypothetical protein [Peribacillus butanolivorans]|nr:hypothetical protein [Peribacillus butanolivorans]